MVFHKCNRLHPDYHVFDMLSDLLSAGRSSRLIQHLVVERQVFGSIDAYISGSIDAGMFYVVGKLAPGITLEEAEVAVWQELEAMKKKVEKIESVYLEQLHYEKMIAQKWRILAIVFMIVALVTNIIWVVVWNQYEYEYTEEIISEDVITTFEQGDGTNTITGVDVNGTTYNY